MYERYRAVSRQHPALVSLIWLGAVLCLPGGFLLAAGYSAQPTRRGLLTAGWVVAGIGLSLMVASNYFLQLRRRASHDEQ